MTLRRHFIPFFFSFSFLSVLLFSNAPAFAKEYLDSVTPQEAEFRQTSDVSSPRQKHFFIRFKPGEKFVFVVSKKLLLDEGAPFYSDGRTVFWYEESGQEIPFAISNRLLKFRNGLVAAKEYWDRQAAEAGITLNFWKPDQPILVLAGNPSASDENAVAVAMFTKQLIVFMPHWTGHLTPETTAIHEYFHFVQDAVWHNGVEEDFRNLYIWQSKEPYRSFMAEMTAEWSTDEPIPVAQFSGPPVNSDDDNGYWEHRGTMFVMTPDKAFFEKSSYAANIFIKYLAEQYSGGDPGDAQETLKLIRDMSLKGLRADTFFQTIAESLPDRLKTYPEWQENWKQFFTRFCASNHVQNAAVTAELAERLGYFDPGAATPNASGVRVSKGWSEDSSKAPGALYPEPAQDDNERKKRLEALLGGDETIEPLAYRLHQISSYMNSRGPAPRPVYVLARGVANSDVFILRQKYPASGAEYARVNATFERVPAFTFLGQREAKEPEAFAVIDDFQRNASEIQEIWVGLVNPGPPAPHLGQKVIQWGYLASPRLIPFVTDSSKPSGTVDLVGGSALGNDAFDNGDTFELEIRSTGPLHRPGADLNNLLPQDLSVELTGLDSLERKIDFELTDGKPFKVSGAEDTSSGDVSYNYRFSGRIAEDNAATGACRFRFRLTSLLNLGGKDEQIDESFKFNLESIVPKVTEVVIHQESREGAPLIYDSENGLRRTAYQKNSDYLLKLRVRFSLSMRERDVTAGSKAPFNQYAVENFECSNGARTCEGQLTIPKADVPAGGILLRLAISGESGQALDANPFEAGAQPDTNHFVILGVEELYKLSVTAEENQKIITPFGEQILSKLGPIHLSTYLMFSPAADGDTNQQTGFYRGQLTKWRLKAESLKARLSKNQAAPVLKKDPLAAANQNLNDLGKAMAPAFSLPELPALPTQPGPATPAPAPAQSPAELWPGEELELAEKQIIPLLEELLALTEKLKEFEHNSRLGSPLHVHFEGASIQAAPLAGPSSDRYDDYRGKVGVFQVRTGKASATPWSSLETFLPNDPLRLPPGVSVWALNEADLKKVRAYLEAPSPAAREVLAHFCNLVWSFFPEKDRPDFSKSPLILPDFAGGKLWKLRGLEHMAEIPFRMTGRTVDLLHEGDDEFGRPVNLPSNEEFVTSDTPEHRRKGSTRYFRGEIQTVRGLPATNAFGRVTEEIFSQEGKMGWTGGPLPAFFFNMSRQSSWSFYPDFHPGASSALTPQPLTLVLSETAGPVSYDLLPGNRMVFYTRPQGENAAAKLTGTHEFFQSNGYPKERELKWETRWRLNRISEELEKEGPDQQTQTAPSQPPVPPPAAAPVSTTPVTAPSTSQSAPSATVPPASPKAPSASSTAPETGITTESRGNPSGSRTVTRTDKQGNILSEEIIPAGPRPFSASAFDPETRVTTSIVKQPDGKALLTQTGENGKILNQKIVG